LGVSNASSPDHRLLALLRIDPARGWDAFLERYASFIFEHLQRIGFDYDEAMDRFVHICEKLAEDDCRRLRGIQHLGLDGELVPWLRRVVENLSVSWFWSVEGRQRRPGAIERLSSTDQRVFELHYRVGLTPSAILEQLHAERPDPIGPAEVFESLERVLTALTASNRWRLMGRLLRRQRPSSLTALAEAPSAWEPANSAMDAESSLLLEERDRRLEHLLETLPVRHQLVLRLRLEEALGYEEIATSLGISRSSAQRSFREGLDQLRALWLEGFTQPRTTRGVRP
jgi:RNA polymerase sigma factor (sigma-70 family)